MTTRNSLQTIRRGAREAEGAPLLREYRVKSLIEGSNPSLSAIQSLTCLLRQRIIRGSLLCSNAPVAQLDRVPGYELGGREFESLRARQSKESRRQTSVGFFVSDCNPERWKDRVDRRDGATVPLSACRCGHAQVPHRGIAQSGRAPALGAGCRGFESLCPDHLDDRTMDGFLRECAGNAPVAQSDRASAF